MTLDDFIRALVPQVDESIRLELQAALRTLRSAGSAPGAILGVSRAVEGMHGLVERIAKAAGWKLNAGTLEGQVEELVRNGIIPGEIASDLHWLRVRVNKARHHSERAELTLDDAETALGRAMRVIRWFYCECPSGPRLPDTVRLPSPRRRWWLRAGLATVMVGSAVTLYLVTHRPADTKVRSVPAFKDVPLDTLATEFAELLGEDQRQIRQRSKSAPSDADMRDLLTGSPVERIFNQLLARHGYDKGYMAATREDNQFMNDLLRHIGKGRLVRFPVADDQVNRLNSEPLRAVLTYQLKSTADEEREWAKSFGSFAAKCSSGAMVVSRQADIRDRALRQELEAIRPEMVTEIDFIEVDDSRRGYVRLTRPDPMYGFLVHNVDNPDKANRAYAHNLLGHVYYLGLLGQLSDRKKSLDHFLSSYNLAREVGNTHLIRSNGLLLAVMHAAGIGMPTSDETKAREILDEVRRTPRS